MRACMILLANISIVDDKISEKDENKKIDTTENPTVSIIENLSEVVCKTHNFNENKKKYLLMNCIIVSKNL